MAQMNTVIADLAAAFAADSTMDVWSRMEYSQGVTVLENCDPRNEPLAGDCPLVILYPMGKAGGLTMREKTLIVGISCVVFDSETPASLEGVTRFEGGRNVETLRGYVVDVIQDNIPANHHIEAVITEYNTIEAFPYVSANMELTLTQEKLIGADPYE